jgi:hypothetical protein
MIDEDKRRIFRSQGLVRADLIVFSPNTPFRSVHLVSEQTSPRILPQLFLFGESIFEADRLITEEWEECSPCQDCGEYLRVAVPLKFGSGPRRVGRV